MATLTAGVALTAGAVLAGCGSSGSSGTSAGHHRARPSHVYRVTLAPPPGATRTPVPTGVAVIALHDSPGELCWRFAHLHGFSGARSAAITSAPTGTTHGVVIHLAKSTELHHQGCRHLSATTLSAIAAHPETFTVTIPTTAEPKGALSGRL